MLFGCSADASRGPKGSILAAFSGILGAKAIDFLQMRMLAAAQQISHFIFAIDLFSWLLSAIN